MPPTPLPPRPCNTAPIQCCHLKLGCSVSGGAGTVEEKIIELQHPAERKVKMMGAIADLELLDEAILEAEGNRTTEAQWSALLS